MFAPYVKSPNVPPSRREPEAPQEVSEARAASEAVPRRIAFQTQQVEAPRFVELLDQREGPLGTQTINLTGGRLIEVGVDGAGDGSRDLDASRVYYFGASLGGIYAKVFAAVEPQVRATVANVAGGSLIENRRLLIGRGLLLAEEVEGEASRDRARIARRAVDARGHGIAGPHARLEEVLRLEVALVEQIVHGEVEIDPAT